MEEGEEEDNDDDDEHVKTRNMRVYKHLSKRRYSFFLFLDL